MDNKNFQLKLRVDHRLREIEEGGGFSILTCFSRSFDESHIKNKRIHLISSSVLFNRYINKDMIRNSDIKIFKKKLFLYIVLPTHFFSETGFKESDSQLVFDQDSEDD